MKAKSNTTKKKTAPAPAPALSKARSGSDAAPKSKTRSTPKAKAAAVPVSSTVAKGDHLSREISDRQAGSLSHAPSTVADGKHLRLVAKAGWEFVQRKNVTGVVVIVAVTVARNLLLVEQFRRPLERRVIELPAGLAGDIAGSETELLAVAAQRELLEETGYEAAEMQYLTAGPTSAGLTDEVVTFFLATGLNKTGRGGGDDSEAIDVHEIPLASIRTWLDDRANEGLSIDPKVYAGLFFLAMTMGWQGF